MNIVSRVGRAIAGLPKRLLAAAGWAQMEPMGFGIKQAQPPDIEEAEAERRRERETWRRDEKDSD